DLTARYVTDAGTRPFTVEPGRGVNVRWRLDVPSGVRPLAFEVRARSGELADGERRPLPVLPSRMHLLQSDFVVLRNDDRRTLELEDLARAGDDPTLEHERLVVTVEARLLDAMLRAVPYLVT